MSNLNPHGVVPYLTVKRAGEFVEFVKRVFGAEELKRMGPPEGPVMHGEFAIGGTVIMYSETFGDDSVRGMVLVVHVQDCDAVYQTALQAGAKSLAEPQKQFQIGRIAKVEDPFGIRWTILAR